MHSTAWVQLLQSIAEMRNSKVQSERKSGRHLHGDVGHQLLELLAAGDKVRLAIDLHQHAQPAAEQRRRSHARKLGRTVPVSGRRAKAARLPTSAACAARLMTVRSSLREVLAQMQEHWQCPQMLLVAEAQCRNKRAPRAGMDVLRDEALRGDAARLLARLRQALHPQRLQRLQYTKWRVENEE